MNQVPNNLMAEQNVIGGLLLDPQSDNAQSIFSLLKPEDFYAQHHQTIYLTLREMYTQRMPIDIMTVTDCLESKGRINQSGGFAYLAEIAREIPSIANIMAYAKKIRECSAQRFVIEKTVEIQNLMMVPSELSFTDKIEQAQRLLDEATSFGKMGRKTGLRRIDDVLDDVFTDICDRQDNPEKHRGLKTGFKDFDRLLSPKQIVIGSLFVIGARPKMGKTTVLTEMAKNVSQ